MVTSEYQLSYLALALTIVLPGSPAIFSVAQHHPLTASFVVMRNGKNSQRFILSRLMTLPSAALFQLS